MSVKRFIPEEPRARLITAVIEEIERTGMAQVTVRAIAARAGMNIAAVNYHFNSKEALLEAAMLASMTHTLADGEQYLNAMSEAPASSLCDFCCYLLDGAQEFPNLTRAHMHDAFTTGDYGGAFPKAFVRLSEQLRDQLSTAARLDSAEAARRSIALLSGVFFPAFFPGLFATLKTKAQRRTYAEELVRRALEPLRAKR
jgi:TetR/AcrR family transcriptional regulator, regulator of cefoperazone and chloramphenicol sensitivity